MRLDDSFLARGQYANTIVYSKDQALDLMDKKLGNIKSNFEFLGLTDDGSYMFLSFPDKEDIQLVYIVDHANGNIYDNRGSWTCIGNVYMIDGMQMLSSIEMIHILNRMPGYKDYEIKDAGIKRGMYLFDFYKNGKLMFTSTGDPVSGDIFESNGSRGLNVRDLAVTYKSDPMVITYEIDPNVTDFNNSDAIKFMPNNIAVQAYSDIILKPKNPANAVKVQIGDLKKSKVLGMVSDKGSIFNIKAKSNVSGNEKVTLSVSDNLLMKGTLHVKVLNNYTKRW